MRVIDRTDDENMTWCFEVRNQSGCGAVLLWTMEDTTREGDGSLMIQCPRCGSMKKVGGTGSVGHTYMGAHASAGGAGGSGTAGPIRDGAPRLGRPTHG